ncbi:alanyl-tRNA synthetase [Streptomyces sp. SCL15-4]|uniref:alanyl-tRNA synthetase n=1 Tax=Streptomyces sp. SCL15-4 TaxID=2967221 RepID=UPI0029668E2D|nr:alanyl-tRNA synthetase [Streptomyces sp. SCL15-4]
MQRHIYLKDTYRFTVTTRVVDAGSGELGYWLTLQDNIFHPQGGGQPSDVGTVDETAARPFKAPETDEHVVRLSCERPFTIGDEVTSAIDPEARRRHAALHTCGHVVDGFVRQLGFRHRVSNHFPGQARIEFDAGEGGKPDLQQLAATVEERTRQAIEADRKVYATEQGDRRIIGIDGLQEDPCGGTHVSSLGQLTGFSLRSVKIKGGVLKVGYVVEHV